MILFHLMIWKIKYTIYLLKKRETSKNSRFKKKVINGVLTMIEQLYSPPYA